ncbi:hypothetical protein MNEG_13008, partial [Monoraphidium neglectum]
HSARACQAGAWRGQQQAPPPGAAAVERDRHGGRPPAAGLAAWRPEGVPRGSGV